MSPRVMLVFATLGKELKVTGAEHEVPLLVDPVEATENPLSVASREFVTFTAEPTCAWYVVVLTVMLAAKTSARSVRQTFAATSQPALLTRRT